MSTKVREWDEDGNVVLAPKPLKGTPRSDQDRLVCQNNRMRQQVKGMRRKIVKLRRIRSSEHGA